MNKQVLSGMGLGALLLFILIGAGVYVSSQPGSVPNDMEGSISEDVVNEFTEEMRAGAIARVGQPIEGFEPFMFMRAFPGLYPQDFDGVDALIGVYRYQNGEVVYDLNGEVETHSAARAISDEGMRQLLINIVTKNHTIFADLLDTPDFVTQMLNSLASTPDPLPSNPAAGGGIEPTLFDTKVTFKGEIVCLPKKGDGPHTMECAYGLKADNGSHYALKNLFNEPGPWEFDVTDRIEVTGMLRVPEANTSYDIVGTIEVESKRAI